MGMGLERCFLMARAKKASFSLMPNLLGLSWSGREGTHYMHETDTQTSTPHSHSHSPTHTHMYTCAQTDRQTEKERERERVTHTYLL